jgi:hypothetical protein
MWRDSLCPFLRSWREDLRLLGLASLGVHQCVTLTLWLYLHTGIFEMKINHPLLYAIEIQRENLPIAL